MQDQLVYIDEYGLRGTNFYWHKYASKGLSQQDVLDAGLTNDRVQVHKHIIDKLVAIDKALQKRGYKMFIKEGYRSQALCEIIYQRRVEKFGQAETDRLINMNDMPHAFGLSVDVTLWDPKTNTEVYLRNGDDGTDALFVDFYKDKRDKLSQRYQELQEWMIGIMQDHGFRLGTRREYFHFDYRPETKRNYCVGKKQQVLFIHGGDAYSQYEDFLADLHTKPLRELPTAAKSTHWTDTLTADLGADYEVLTPTMPNKQNAQYEEWKIWFERQFEHVRDEVILVGWSLGGAFLTRYLSENKAPFAVTRLFLLATAYDYFVSPGSKEDGGDFYPDLTKVPLISNAVGGITIMHSQDDSVVPYEHAEKYVAALPHAEMVTFTDKNHFLGPKLPELLERIRGLV